MNANATDSQLTETQARRCGPLLRSRVARRGAIVAAALSAAVLLSSCEAYVAPTSTPVDKLSTGDAVLAVWMREGRSVSGIGKPTYDSGIGLLDEEGNVDLSFIDERTVGDLAWTQRGLSYSEENNEFLTTASGTQRIPRPADRSLEYRRYELPDGRIAVLSASRHWGFRIDTIELDGTMTSAETRDTEGDVGLCGSRVLAITDTQESESIKGSAREAYAAQSGSQTDVPEELAAVVQLDDPVGDVPRVLATAPMIDGLKSGQFMFACEGDVITMPSMLQDDPVAARDFGMMATTGPMVLQRWDLSTGQRTVIPVLDENGDEITLSKDLTIFGYQAIQVGDEYRFISSRGHAFTVDLRSGQTRHLFTIPAETVSHRTLFQVTETGVYVLEDRHREHLVTISYRPWDGGDLREVFTTNKLEKYLRTPGGFLSSGHEREIESFALRPGWDGGAQ
mgnify:FL=1